MNMFMFKPAGVKCLVALAFFSLSNAGSAQGWPNRPVRLIVSQAAGGTPDIVARVLAERLGAALGQAMVVENRPGSANMVGAQAAARDCPVGYTVCRVTDTVMSAKTHHQ